MASIIADLLQHEAGVDIIAVLAIGGALLLGESLAAAVIAVMLATGDWLERYAAGRAHRELSALISRAPRIVHRHEGGEIVDHPIAEVEVGDRILVKPGEVVPVDGTRDRRPGRPRRVGADRRVAPRHPRGRRSGELRHGQRRRAVRPPCDRDRRAQHLRGHRAPGRGGPIVEGAVRPPRRPVRAALRPARPRHGRAGLGPVRRPRPRALGPRGRDAVPAAARGADRDRRRDQPGGPARDHRQGRRGARVPRPGPRPPVRQDRHADGRAAPPRRRRHGARLDPRRRAAAWPPRWSRSRRTCWRPRSSAAPASAAWRSSFPRRSSRYPGSGVSGRVGGRRSSSARPTSPAAAAGLPVWARDVRRRVSLEGATSVFVAVDGVLVGALVLDDPIRPETPRVIRSLRRAGVRRTVMVTGDHYGVADMVAAAIGVDAVLAERTPADKVDAVTRRASRGRRHPGDGRRRDQRRPRPGRRRRRRGDGGARRHRQLRGRGHRHHRGPAGPAAGGDPDRPPVPDDRHPERRDRHGPVHRGDAGSR